MGHGKRSDHPEITDPPETRAFCRLSEWTLRRLRLDDKLTK
jgi:hypothetical protein